MKELNLYQNKNASIGFGLVFGILSLVLLALSYLFISGTLDAIDSVKDLFLSLVFYSLFLFPAIFLMIVSIKKFKSKILVCTLNKRQLIITEFTGRMGATTDKKLNINDIKKITLTKGIRIELKNNTEFPCLYLNMNLSHSDKLKLQLEIQNRITS